MRRRSGDRFFLLLRRSPHLMTIAGRSAKRSEFTKTKHCSQVDSRSGSRASAEPSSCLSFRFPKQKQKEPKRKGSVSFSTWLTRSVEVKNKSIEWLLAMEEIKGRSYNSSPILKPETETLSAETRNNASLAPGNSSSLRGQGHAAGPDWSDTYAARYVAPQYFQG
jgi:hypothetical protein